MPSSPASRVPVLQGSQGTGPGLTSEPRTLSPQAQRGEAAILPHDLPSEGRKRPPWSPINHGILFCSVGQMKRCRDPRPCVLWRGESFSSRAAAKHLPVSPRPGEPAPLLFILPWAPSHSPAGARVVVPVSARDSGISGCGCCARPALGLASASSPESCCETCPGQHFWRD